MVCKRWEPVVSLKREGKKSCDVGSGGVGWTVGGRRIKKSMCRSETRSVECNILHR